MKALKGVLVRSRKNFLSFCDIWKKLFLRFSELIFDQYCSIFFQFFFTRFRSFKLLLAIPVGFQAVSAAGPTGLPTSEMIKIVLLAVNKFSTSCSTQRASSQLTFCPKRKRSHAIQALLSADPSVQCDVKGVPCGNPNSQKRLLLFGFLLCENGFLVFLRTVVA